jgi:hypothetical protein
MQDNQDNERSTEYTRIKENSSGGRFSDPRPARPGRGVNHPPSSAEVMPLLPLGAFIASYRENLTLTFTYDFVRQVSFTHLQTELRHLGTCYCTVQILNVYGERHKGALL